MAHDEWVDIGAAASFAARPLPQVALSRTCLSISHRDGRFCAISGVRACLVVLSLLLFTPFAPAGAAESAPPETSIPAIAGIAKTQIGREVILRGHAGTWKAEFVDTDLFK